MPDHRSAPGRKIATARAAAEGPPPRAVHAESHLCAGTEDSWSLGTANETCIAFHTNFNQCSTIYAASVILGSGLTGILTDSAHSQNAETGGFIGSRPIPNTQTHDSSRFGGEVQG